MRERRAHRARILVRIVNPPMPLLILGTALRVVIWLVYGPFSGLIPLSLLYGLFEFGIDFFASRSRRERRLDAAMLITCALGVVVLLMKPHVPAVMLSLFCLSIVATIVALSLSIRGKSRRKKRRSGASVGGGAASAPFPKTEMAQS